MRRAFDWKRSSISDDAAIASNKLQTNLLAIQSWLAEWRKHNYWTRFSAVHVVETKTGDEFFPELLVLPPLWSSGQISWLQMHRAGFDSELYLRSIVSGTGSTQPREYN
jgi:hypothetical protein